MFAGGGARFATSAGDSQRNGYTVIDGFAILVAQEVRVARGRGE